jgi:hypothetical protein
MATHQVRDPGQHSKMTEYTRRRAGTTFVSILCEN